MICPTLVFVAADIIAGLTPGDTFMYNSNHRETGYVASTANTGMRAPKMPLDECVCPTWMTCTCEPAAHTTTERTTA